MKSRITLGIILFAALTIRVFFALRCEAIPDYSDMAIYNEAATAGSLSSYPPPGYPLFLRAVYSIFGPLNYKAAYVAQAIVSVLSVFLAWYICKRLCSIIAGLSAAAIAAIYPPLIAYNLTTLTESLSIVLTLTILAIAVSPHSEKKRAVSVGALLAAAFFFRPSVLLFFPGLFFGMKKRFLMAGTLAAILVPIFIYGSLTGTGEGRGPRAVYKAYNPLAVKSSNFSIDETEIGRGASAGEYLKGTASFISANKWVTVSLIYRKGVLLVSKGWDDFALKGVTGESRFARNMLIFGYLPVMLLGLFGIARYGDPKNRVVWLMILGYALIHIVITIFKIRYRLLIEPLLIIYAGIAISRIVESRLSHKPELLHQGQLI